MRPRPQWGQGWRKGGFKFLKKDFYRSVFLMLTGVFIEEASVSLMKHPYFAGIIPI